MSVIESYQKIRAEIERVIFGLDEAIEFAMAGLFSGGHVLLEGPPGTAKTLLVRTIATALDMDFQRIQMTPDLLPNDITGSAIYREDEHRFEFVKGPIFTNFLLADEVNRSSARTQSALLEAMQEINVTYDRTTYALPQPFMTFATQNPIEQEGTYPLPLAQLDRFMFKIEVGYPEGDAEEEILKAHHATGGRSDPTKMNVSAVITPQEIALAQEEICQTHVRDEVVTYLRKLLQATRIDDALEVGASPRSGLMLLMGAKSIARFAERDFVTPDDIKAVFLPSLRHRIVLSASAELEGMTADNALTDVLETVEVPR